MIQPTAHDSSPDRAVHVSVIVPFHRNLRYLERCLSALVPASPDWEIIVAADGAVDDCHALAGRYGALVLDLPGPRGPAVARNRASEAARGDILVFIDADVVASVDVVARAARVFDTQPETAAVFGAYDETPADPGFVSQYKNLAHSYVHQSSFTVAQTFWAGFGAVRRAAFLAVGGFDERFPRPSVEDIDLGYRLTAAGFRIVLDPSLTACHLKRWTVRSMIASDVLDRGIPWTQLILRYGRFNNDLNLRSAYRACVVLAYLVLMAAGLAFVDVRFLAAVPILVGALVMLSPRYYRFFHRRRGLWFAARVFPLHYVYHLYNGFSFVVGTSLYHLARHTTLQWPGGLPSTPWTVGLALATRRGDLTRPTAAPVPAPAPALWQGVPRRAKVVGVSAAAREL